MKPYIGLVHKDAESAYGITFPDAPGCFSAADHLDDVFVNASEALSGWTDTMHDQRLPIPPTRDYSAIRSDPGWSEAFGDAVVVIAVPAPSRIHEAA